jgi:zinc transporter, ZIP family
MLFDSTLLNVLFLATLTAVATGLGALPFAFFKKVSPRWMGLSNAAAAGLMLAACHSLVAEGIELSPVRLLIGLLIGLAAIVVSHRFISDYDVPKIAQMSQVDARKSLLIVGIMTAHSFAEGIGVGVSFGGGEALATYISAAIAIHNVPEGLAIALILIPLGTPVWKAALWAIFSSLPQPIMAVPSYLFVEIFEPVLPIGFGLAAGAMIWMVFSELVPDATKDAKTSEVASIVTAAFTAMLAFQYLILK